MKKNFGKAETECGKGGGVYHDSIWENNAEAGPSTWMNRSLDRSAVVEEEEGRELQHSLRRDRRRIRSINNHTNNPTPPTPSSSHSRCRPPRKPGALVSSLLFLPFLVPSLSAPTRTLSVSPTSTIDPTSEYRGNGDSPLVYLTTVTTPTTLPSETVTVPATVLPYYLTQKTDGSWEKVDSAWSLYGRQAGVSD